MNTTARINSKIGSPYVNMLNKVNGKVRAPYKTQHMAKALNTPKLMMSGVKCHCDITKLKLSENNTK